jgi:hypothetical protein
MRRALPLALVALAAAGCGGRTYSAADVHRAFAGFHLEQVPVQLPPGYHPVFATWAAVTDLRIDEGMAFPAASYGSTGVTIERYRTPHEAAVSGDYLVVTQVVRMGHEPPRITVERHGNLVVIVSGRRRQVEAAAARLP